MTKTIFTKSYNFVRVAPSLNLFPIYNRPFQINIGKSEALQIKSMELIIETLHFFVFERTKHQPRRNLRSYLVLQRLCNEAALSPGIDAFWY